MYMYVYVCVVCVVCLCARVCLSGPEHGIGLSAYRRACAIYVCVRAVPHNVRGLVRLRGPELGIWLSAYRRACAMLKARLRD